MTYKILPILIIIATISSCVSPKVVEEIKQQRQETFQENQKIKKENTSLSTENIELKDKLSRLNSEITQLISDSTTRSVSCRQLQSQLDDLNEAYDLLTAKNSQMMINKAEETKKLLKELQKTREDLLNKEDVLLTLEQNLSVKQNELLNTQNELVEREKKVVELQSIINKKDSLLSALKDRISSALLGFEGDGLTITQKNGKVYISLEEQLLFASGSWQVDSRGREALSKLSKALENQQDINVLIEGHTDNIPFGGRGQIKDNWDLSVVRATAIVRILTSSSSIDPKRLTAAGKGEFVPIQSNSTSAGRSANRRIEIILTPKLYDLYELLED
ncbi:MAG: OmpA family protein [Bacteroidota bacterium]|nr:OmpA family protein [Bacteroidota bacterium]